MDIVHEEQLMILWQVFLLDSLVLSCLTWNFRESLMVMVLGKFSEDYTAIPM